MTKREEKGISIINSHEGKKKVYDLYKETNPEMASKYLDYISNNMDAQYIIWEPKKRRFV